MARGTSLAEEVDIFAIIFLVFCDITETRTEWIDMIQKRIFPKSSLPADWRLKLDSWTLSKRALVSIRQSKFDNVAEWASWIRPHIVVSNSRSTSILPDGTIFWIFSLKLGSKGVGKTLKMLWPWIQVIQSKSVCWKWRFVDYYMCRVQIKISH